MVGLAYYSFYLSFKRHFSNLRVVKEDDVEKFDLIIFSGGEDINPKIYKQRVTHSYYINYIRDMVELSILEQALKLDKKILGVCRGHQLINAYLGGNLVQDIYIDLGQDHEGQHGLNFLENGIISDQFSEVNSLHHQGVIEPGENLIPTSEYKGVIESTESDQIISVQFHPEFMKNTQEFFNYIKEWSGVTNENT